MGAYNRLRKTLAHPLPAAEEAVRARLKEAGFGILTEIDVASTLKEKIDVDFRPYRILGACNPTLAHQALQEELDIGLLLPCNVVLYEADDPGSTEVLILDPEEQLAVSGRDDLDALAADVRQRMEGVLAAL